MRNEKPRNSQGKLNPTSTSKLTPKRPPPRRIPSRTTLLGDIDAIFAPMSTTFVSSVNVGDSYLDLKNGIAESLHIERWHLQRFYIADPLHTT